MMGQPTMRTLMADLRAADLDVVEGRAWEQRGDTLDGAHTVKVTRTNSAGKVPVVEEIRQMQEQGVCAYIRRSGEVWLLGAAHEGVAQVVMVVPKGEKPTIRQRDAADAVVAILDAMSEVSKVEDEEDRETDGMSPAVTRGGR